MTAKPRRTVDFRMCEQGRVSLPGARKHPGHRRIPSRIYHEASQCHNPWYHNVVPGSRSMMGNRGWSAIHDLAPPDHSRNDPMGLWKITAYLAENSSYVSSSWAPERRIEVVLKLGRLIARATGVCTRDRGNWEALKRLEGRTERVARRKMEVEDMVRRVGWGRVDELAC